MLDQSGTDPTTTTNGFRLKLHQRDLQSGESGTENQDTAGSWSGDCVVLCALLEQMGSEREDWKAAAARQAVDALIVQLMNRSQAQATAGDAALWDRLILLATLLGYRDLLSALCGDIGPLRRRLSRDEP